MKTNSFKDLIINGSKAPSDLPRNNVKVLLSKEISNEYIPLLDKIEAPKGLKILATVMAQSEGFFVNSKGLASRSYKSNNPGNIGNTDNGKNRIFKTLEEGIKFQLDFLLAIAKGNSKYYPLGKNVFLKPFYSEEIFKNQKLYGLQPYCPGYKFKYFGALDQFIKIYSTAARQNNNYLSIIISYFKQNGYDIAGNTLLSDLITLK